MKTLRMIGLVGILAGSALVFAPTLVLAQHEDEAHEEGGTHGDSGAHEEAHAWEWNWTRLAGGFFNFAVWAGIVIYGLGKVVPPFLAKRRAGIVDGLEEARQLTEAAQTKHAEYSERIDNLDAELERLREEFKRAGLEERDRMVAEASSRAEKTRAEARFLIEQQMKQLREDLTREAVEAAVSAAEKILRERSTTADQQRLADDYLSRLKGSITSRTAATKPETVLPKVES
jgi:F-type H+-transporting ATPase subunit b